MECGPAVNLVSSRLAAITTPVSDICQERSWQHLQDTTVTRTDYSRATMEDAVLLIVGDYSDSTEWIPVDGIKKLKSTILRLGISDRKADVARIHRHLLFHLIGYN